MKHIVYYLTTPRHVTMKLNKMKLTFASIYQKYGRSLIEIANECDVLRKSKAAA